MPSASHSHLWLMEGLDDGLSIEPVTGDLFRRSPYPQFHTVRELVAGTDGFGIGHASQLGDGLQSKGFATLNLPSRKPPTAQIGIAYKRERTLFAGRALVHRPDPQADPRGLGVISP